MRMSKKIKEMITFELRLAETRAIMGQAMDTEYELIEQVLGGIYIFPVNGPSRVETLPLQIPSRCEFRFLESVEDDLVF